MNLNKEVPRGTISLIVSIVFLVAGAFLLLFGLSTIKSDDGSGLGSFLGQITIFIAAVAFLIGIIAFMVSRNAKGRV